MITRIDAGRHLHADYPPFLFRIECVARWLFSGTPSFECIHPFEDSNSRISRDLPKNSWHKVMADAGSTGISDYPEDRYSEISTGPCLLLGYQPLNEFWIFFLEVIAREELSGQPSYGPSKISQKYRGQRAAACKVRTLRAPRGVSISILRATTDE